MKNFLYRFMAGRYGNDTLNKFLTGLWLGTAVLSIFLDKKFIYYIVWALCLLVLFRSFSRNIPARQKENAFFLRISKKPLSLFGGLKAFADRLSQRKTHRFFKCPSCGTMLRVPRRKGRMNIRCVRCGNQFSRKIR
ncbi:MAG: hypothetical protein IKT60_07225 [Clostridia bacterium]|nr:hypothetical protein [Clostridia bacterium]